MFGKESVLFPFDGDCERSKDADFTIVFPESAALKAHSRHLREASSVLQTAIDCCRHDGTLNVGEDNREAWRLLLNLVHPGRRTGVPNFADELNFERIEIYARLAEKYDIDCMRDYVDAGLCRVIEQLRMTMPQYFDASLREDLLSRDQVLFQSLRLAARYILVATKEAYKGYLHEIIKKVKRNVDGRRLDSKVIEMAFTKHVSVFSEEGDCQFATAIADEISQLLQH